MGRTEIKGESFVQNGRSGPRYKWRAYRWIEKNAERFVITREEWT